MKPIFTVHAGEYLVGSYIEKHFPNLNVWLPSKDTGIDLLVTNSDNTKGVSLLVKFSKDFVTRHPEPEVQRGLKSMGWWTLKGKKIRESRADLWILVLYSFTEKHNQYLILPPEVLYRRLEKIHGQLDTFQSYFWVTHKDKCWEARGLSKTDRILLANDAFKVKRRDFTEHLNNWQLITKVF